ncbi:MAG: YraN family protein [Dehalococcoidia bacterium]|nr:YraN family protein [Dehalococcoidia bacterium]
MNKQETGALGEESACRFLASHGYNIIRRNYRSPHGEIDIIAVQDGTMCFVEVRAKTGLGFGTPEESVTESKKQKLILTAEHYLQTCDPQPADWRIDFIGVDIDFYGKIKSIRHTENAVSEE